MSDDIETVVLAVEADAPDAEVIARAAGVLRRGGLVAFPTETVYGLGANATDAEAVARIFAAKGRPASDPVIAHVSEVGWLEQVAVAIPGLAYRLAERFWPGPLTLVLRRGPAIPANVAAGGPTVAVRMPRHGVALALIRAAGVPVAAPSANRFSRPSPTTAAHVLDDLRGRVDVVLDGGPTPVGVESTVLDVTGAVPVILRPGGVPVEALREIVPEVTQAERYLREGDEAASPGMLLKHYSPNAEVRVYAGERGAVLGAMTEAARALRAQGRRVGVLALDEDRTTLAEAADAVVVLGGEGDPEGVARRLFAALRELDADGVDVMLVRGVERRGLGAAVWDRLVRAAEGRVVWVGQEGST